MATIKATASKAAVSLQTLIDARNVRLTQAGGGLNVAFTDAEYTQLVADIQASVTTPVVLPATLDQAIANWMLNNFLSSIQLTN